MSYNEESFDNDSRRYNTQSTNDEDSSQFSMADGRSPGNDSGYTKSYDDGNDQSQNRTTGRAYAGDGSSSDAVYNHRTSNEDRAAYSSSENTDTYQGRRGSAYPGSDNNEDTAAYSSSENTDTYQGRKGSAYPGSDNNTYPAAGRDTSGRGFDDDGSFEPTNSRRNNTSSSDDTESTYKTSQDNENSDSYGGQTSDGGNSYGRSSAQGTQGSASASAGGMNAYIEKGVSYAAAKTGYNIDEETAHKIGDEISSKLGKFF